MSTDNADGFPAASDPVPAVRARILATEHWSLLAARGTAQSEFLEGKPPVPVRAGNAYRPEFPSVP